MTFLFLDISLFVRLGFFCAGFFFPPSLGAIGALLEAWSVSFLGGKTDNSSNYFNKQMVGKGACVQVWSTGTCDLLPKKKKK